MSGRSPLFDTTFHFPAAKASLSARPRDRVNAPGLYLQSNPEPLLDPFGFWLPPPPSFFCLTRRVPHRNPLSIPASRLTACLLAFTSLQDLSIPPDQSTMPKPNRRSLSLRTARSSFAPHLTETFYDRRALDQRSGSATARQTRCSSNLLEPSS